MDIEQQMTYDINITDMLKAFPEYNGSYNPKPVLRSTIKSFLGKPIIEPLKFLGGNYQTRRDGETVNVPYEGMTLPASTFIEINQTKHIVKTKIAGRSGTIKEHISDGDYIIRVKGLFVNEEAGKYLKE